MRTYLITLVLGIALVLGLAWNWGLKHRLDYLSRDYALLNGKDLFIDNYNQSGLVIFGDSAAMDGFVPERLGPAVINLGMSGCTAMESYFFSRRMLKVPVRPLAIVLSYNSYHFVHPDFYWENSVKFGLVSGAEADEVFGQILKFHDKELLSDSGLWHVEQGVYSFLLSRGFPSYYISSLVAEPWGARKKENEEALGVIAKTRGQYYFPLANGSKSLNADTKLKDFTVSPVVDYYFRKTLELWTREKVPIYFYAMPINETSVSHLEPGVVKGYADYLENLTRENSNFHILSNLQTVYPWKLFSDYAHLNEKGTLRFNREFAKILNKVQVPGGPYGTR